MVRPRIHEPGSRVSSAVRIPRDLHDRLKAEAERRCIGMNLLMTAVLDYALADFESEALLSPLPGDPGA